MEREPAAPGDAGAGQMVDVPVVLKFGGSCLRDEASFARAAELVRARPERRKVVVVSAPEGITDGLLRVFPPPTASLHPALAADLVSLGERFSARLLGAVLRAYGDPVRALEPGDLHWPIITQGGPLGATIDLSATAPRVDRWLRPLLEDHIVIVCGYVGVERGVTSTLARGGSDTTAVALGRLLGSRDVLLYKDVPGVLEVDPAIEPKAQAAERLSTEEMRALARGGARVVAPEALEHLLPGMTLRILPFVDGHGAGVGTRISVESRLAQAVGDEVPTPGGIGSITAVPRDLGEGLEAIRQVLSAEPWSGWWITPSSCTVYLPSPSIVPVVRRLHATGKFHAISSRTSPEGPLATGDLRSPSTRFPLPRGVPVDPLHAPSPSP
jgi:aspartokinase